MGSEEPAESEQCSIQDIVDADRKPAFPLRITTFERWGSTVDMFADLATQLRARKTIKSPSRRTYLNIFNRAKGL